MKRFLVLLVGITHFALAFGQTDSASITFIAKTNLPIAIYPPIDEAFQNRLISETLFLKPNEPATRSFAVKDFSNIYLKSSGCRLNILLFPKDRIEVTFVGSEDARIKGNNADAQVYYNNEFIMPGTAHFIDQIRSIATDTYNYDEFEIKAEQTILKPILDTLDAIQAKGKVNPKCITVLKADISSYFYQKAITSLISLPANKTLSTLQEAATKKIALQLTDKVTGTDFKIMKYCLGCDYVGYYYHLLCQKYTEDDKQRLLNGYSEDTFGPYTPFLLAPDSIRLAYFGGACIAQEMFKANEFDLTKMYGYLKANYPNSEYVAIVGEMMAEKEKAKSRGTNNHMERPANFISSTVNSLSDLSSAPELKGKYLLVDIWATWCMPCRMEFAQGKESLLTMLDKHPNLEYTCVSIDDDKQNDSWKSLVEKLELHGYNIRAGSQLKDDIKSKIYSDGEFSIPRYILISPDGKVLNNDLPRPSNTNEFGAAISSLVRN